MPTVHPVYHHHFKGEACDSFCGEYERPPRWYTASLRPDWAGM